MSNAFAGVKPNDITAAPPEGADAAAGAADSLHAEPGKIANDILREAKDAAGAGPSFDVAGPDHADAATQTADAAGHAVEAAAHAADVIYTNPLPHVLILTAIVVGVATTAVGLALAVRVREAYGTIEEDELEAADHIAEFGAPPAETAEAGA
ncbi:MAG: sodium:proton antiporter [Parvularculaceae bacterium]